MRRRKRIPRVAVAPLPGFREPLSSQPDVGPTGEAVLAIPGRIRRGAIGRSCACATSFVSCQRTAAQSRCFARQRGNSRPIAGAIASFGVSHEPPTQATFGSARKSGAVAGETPPVGRTSRRKRTGQRLQHADATGLLRGKQLQLVEPCGARRDDV